MESLKHFCTTKRSLNFGVQIRLTIHRENNPVASYEQKLNEPDRAGAPGRGPTRRRKPGELKLSFKKINPVTLRCFAFLREKISSRLQVFIHFLLWRIIETN